MAKERIEEHENKMALFGASFSFLNRDPAEGKIQSGKIKTIITSAVKYSKIAAE